MWGDEPNGEQANDEDTFMAIMNVPSGKAKVPSGEEILWGPARPGPTPPPPRYPVAQGGVEMLASSIRSHPRITTLTVALIVFTTGAWVLGSGSATAHRAGHTNPRLVMTSRNPATLHGSGFKPLRRVRVTLNAQKTFVRHPLASRHGTFTATFPTVVDYCTAWFASASQRHGASVIVHGPKPECAPASTP